MIYRNNIWNIFRRFPFEGVYRYPYATHREGFTSNFLAQVEESILVQGHKFKTTHWQPQSIWRANKDTLGWVVCCRHSATSLLKLFVADTAPHPCWCCLLKLYVADIPPHPSRSPAWPAHLGHRWQTSPCQVTPAVLVVSWINTIF